MCSVEGRPMVQDIPEQDIVMGELELPPQMDPEPEMGAAAAEAAVYDTSPSLLRNPPPIPAETARPSTPDMDQLFTMLAGINGDIHGMKGEMEANTKSMNEQMEANTKGMNETREETKTTRTE